MDEQSISVKKGADILHHARAAVVLTVLFSATRLFLFTGFPFSMNFLDMGMQLLDPAGLREQLGKTLLYGHIQPPLFNAFVGAVLHIFPDKSSALPIFAFLYFAIGLLLVLGVYALAVSLGAGRWWAFAAAAAYIFWPPNIMEQVFLHPPPEKWLSYDYPVMLLLLGMALCMAAYRNSRKIGWIVCFLLFAAMTVWTRPFFNSLLWFIPSMILAMGAVRGHGKRERLVVLAAASLTLLLSLTPAARNGVMFGWFTDSSFQGMNMASRTLFLDPETLEAEAEKGTVTPLALIPRFSEPEVYLDYYREDRLTGNDLLDAVDKSTGHPNWNHFIMLRASREYGANTMSLLAAHPLEMVKTTINGIYIFFGFRSHQFLWTPGSPPWGFWNVDFPQVRVHDTGSFLWFAGIPVVFAIIFFGVMHLMYREKGDPLFLFILMLMAYTLIVANAAELGHNNLFRKQIDPMVFAGVALWMSRYYRGLRTRLFLP